MESPGLSNSSPAVSTPWRLSQAPAKFLQRLCAPVDIAPLIYFRIVFGAILFWEVLRFFESGWIDRYYVEPTFFFKYFGFEWVTPWPGFGMHLHFVVLGLLTVYIILGLQYRIATGLFFLGFTYVFLLDQANYLNHFYLICLVSFILVFLPANRSFSLDSWRKSALKAETTPAWTLWLLRFQLAVPYVYGGLAKLNADWLRGEPMRTWLEDRTDYPLIGSLFVEEWVVYAFSYGGLLFDLLIVPLLLIPRTRGFAIVWVIAFHLLNMTLFNIGIFPWFMLLSTPIFLPPDRIRHLGHRLGLTKSAPQIGPESVLLPYQRWALASFVTFQLIFPLRHFLYPGNPNWTEEGHRFAWHMKLRTKDSDVHFRLKDAQSGHEWTVYPEDYLTDRQLQKMSGRPDMLLQFSHYLSQEWMNTHDRKVEVYADAFSSLNGREHQRLVDPDVDLSQQPRSIRHSQWILSEGTNRPTETEGSF